MGKAPLTPASPLTVLYICAVLVLTGSPAAADIGTYDEGIAAYDRNDHGRAFAIFDDLALDAHPAALAKAGRMYELGQGTPKNLDEALRYYREGAALGNAEAQASLGRMYLTGTGVPRDQDEGLRLMRQAADQGDGAAIYLLASVFLDGEGVERDTQRGMSLLEVAAEKGNVDARKRMTDIYFNSPDPTASARALAWFEKAAGAGDANAQAQLGYIYETGQGLPQDPARAHFWYLKAAEQGHTDAQAAVGYQFQSGQGTGQNFSEARRWYEMAAAKEQPLAQIGQGVTQDAGKARVWYQKAADNGYAPAAARLSALQPLTE